MAVLVALFLAGIGSVIVSSGLFLSRQVLGYAYSNDRQVVRYISVMTPLICLSFITDSLQAVLSGLFLIPVSFFFWLIYNLAIVAKSLFDSVVVGAFQITFRVKIHANDVFSFFKNYF
jgi:hypothetical protein